MEKFNLIKLRNFRFLYITGLSSEFSSFVLEAAINLFLFSLSGQSKEVMGLGHAVFLVFFSLGGLIGAKLGPTQNKVHVLLISEFLRIPLTIGLLFSTSLIPSLLLFGLIGLFSGVFNPLRQALVNEFVPPENIDSANALFGSTFAFIHMICPIIGTSIYTYLGGLDPVVYFSIFCYFLGITALYKTHYIFRPKSAEIFAVAEKEKTDTLNFKSYVLNRPDILCISINHIITGLCVGLLVSLMLPFTTEVLNKEEYYYGKLLMAFGLGGLIGGIISKKMGQRIHLGKLIMICFFLETFLFLVWSNTHHFESNLTVLFFWGLVVFTKIPVELNFVSRFVPSKYLSQTYTLLDLSFIIPSIGSGVFLAFFGGHFTTLTLLNFTGGFFILAFILRIPTRNVRALIHYKGEREKRVLQID